MKLFGLALSIAVLAGVWTFVSPLIAVLTWPAFVGWAFFFVAGGDAKAIYKAGAPLISGVILGWLGVLASSNLGMIGLAIAVAVIAFIMVMMANVDLFSVIPAQFAACASFFGVGDFTATLIPLVIGVLLGYISAMLPKWFDTKKAETKDAAA